MSKIEVNTVEPQCGTTLTLGASGDTISIASGAKMSGVGTVSWDTTAKTASFTAVSGNGYFVNTTSGAVTMTLPATPSAGDIVSVKDYAGTFATNNLTIARNGSNLDGSAADTVRNTDNESLSLVYVDGTQGWKSVEEGTGFVGETFIVATGGTVTTCGDFKVHTFTGPGTFCVSAVSGIPANNVADYFVVAGGGSGGGADIGGGGGAGGFRMSNDLCMPAPTTSPLANPTGLTLTATSFPITVGGGGAAVTATPGCRPASNNGSNSVFSTITSAGGGGGGSGPTPATAQNGGSGGGAGYNGSAGSGNTPPVSPPQGNNGGTGSPSTPSYGQGGGGGAGAVGGNGTCTAGGVGGVGSFVSPVMAGCNGTPGPVGSTRYFAGGGGGAVDGNTPGRQGAAGGAGGGGRGYATDSGQCAVSGTTNTGGGGGGTEAGVLPSSTSGAGGSGIVIIRYKFQ